MKFGPFSQTALWTSSGGMQWAMVYGPNSELMIAMLLPLIESISSLFCWQYDQFVVHGRTCGDWGVIPPQNHPYCHLSAEQSPTPCGKQHPTFFSSYTSCPGPLKHACYRRPTSGSSRFTTSYCQLFGSRCRGIMVGHSSGRYPPSLSVSAMICTSSYLCSWQVHLVLIFWYYNINCNMPLL